jgi:hypothetical protein
MPITLYRATKGKRPRPSDFWSAFGYGEEPLSAQLERPAMWCGVSMSDDLERAKIKAIELSQGRFLAVLHIPDEALVQAVATSTKRDPHHYSVIGTPAAICSCFVESVPIV